ncbi:tdpoz5 [Trichonephila clavata]|uniref:Tdpoz5 n=1 Tax=Trichonephila clavata TaxID=2740835 RepID=A0A8X6LG75_TRICU|nr:tdpoz5 [Trichonephila clavata]
MSKIDVKWPMDGKQEDFARSCKFSKYMLNQEWLMICWFSKSNSKVPEHIEIRRKYKSKRCSVSGEFQYSDHDIKWKRDFSLYFGPGCESKNVEIPYHVLKESCKLAGYVVISEEPENPALEVNDEKDLLIKSLYKLSNDLAFLLEPNNTAFADILVKCGSVIFHAHKNILSVRWPFFLDVFPSKLTETQKNEVITDIDAHVFEIMLKYTYTGKIENLSVSLAGDVLFASDKYRLEGLKSACCEYIKINISMENVLETLMLGDLHYPDLKVFAMEFICQYCDEFPFLEKTEQWQTLQKEKPSLALEVYTSIVNTKKK